MIALSWDNFLRSNGVERLPDFTFAELDKIHPHIAPLNDPSQHTESQNQVRYEDIVAIVKKRGKSGLIDLPRCEDVLKALEAMRERDLKEWMAEINALEFPRRRYRSDSLSVALHLWPSLLSDEIRFQSTSPPSAPSLSQCCRFCRFCRRSQSMKKAMNLKPV
ncbi:hypothetical protein GGI43DRAFT_433053 [Trichoderma evansii]